MPIIVKDYIWVQTPKAITIKIPISPVNHEKVDVFTSDWYVKASFRPFIFEVFLLHEVDSKKSTCIVKDDLITFDLVKKEETEWENLEKELTKPEKMKLKQEYFEKVQEAAQNEAEEKRIKQTQLDRHAVQRAMDVDAKQLELMDARRDDERNKAMAALEEWRVTASKEEPSRTIRPPSYSRHNHYNYPKLESKDSGVTITELDSSDDDTKKEIVKPTKPDGDTDNKQEIVATKTPKAKIPPVRKPTAPKKTPVRSEYIEKKKEELSKRVLPALRNTAEIQITHTPRTFPTPSRESTADEEAAWLKNVTLARRATGFVSEDLRPEEQDPQWCKDKGDEFFRAGNFLGAISAYSHGIKLSDKLPSLYSNRAATHFALGNFHKCMEDCSTALDLLKPPCEGNRRSRAKCMARRAAALARIGYLHKAIDEMKAAAKLLPEDESIKKDIYDMERAWEQNPDDH